MHTHNEKAKKARDNIETSLWRYVSSKDVALNYDEYFAKSELFRLDGLILDKIIEKPGRLLDMGCGTGRHIVQFAQKNHEVTGVDLSQEMINITRRKLDAHNLRARLERVDMTEMTALPDNYYDYAICMFSTLGMLRKAGRIAAIRQARKKLAHGGILVTHFHNRFYDFFSRETLPWLIGSYLRGIFAPGYEIGDKFFNLYRGISNLRLHLFSIPEIRALMRAGGMKLEEIFFINRSRNDLIPSSPFARFRSNGFIVVAKK